MTKAGKQLLEAAHEAVRVARGEEPAARITIKGHTYVPETERWQPMNSVPKDRAILVYGQPTDVEGCRFLMPGVHTAYWDEIDGAFCIKGATWLGPFIEPICWMEEPPAPVNKPSPPVAR